jgi:phage antirepressor YoqD-like protein
MNYSPKLSASSDKTLVQNEKKVNELQNQEVMTTKELAESLKVDVRTIQRIANELFDPSTVLSQVVNGGVSKVFTEKQAVAIKLKLRERNNLKDNSVVSQIGNDLEFFALLKKKEEEQKVLDAYRDMRITELTNRLKIAETALNRIADGKGCYTMNQAAKALKLPYGNKTLFQNLRTLQVLNQDNSPKQEQINSGHFKVVVKHINDEIGSKPVTLVTGKGLVYLAKKFNAEIDESIQPDA